MLVIMGVPVRVVMSVVVAAVGCRVQQPAEISRHERFNRCARRPGAHGDAVVSEIGQRPVADAPRDDHLHTPLAQPARERAGLVFRGRDKLRMQHGLLVGVHLEEREFAAAAKVSVQPAVFTGNGNGETIPIRIHSGSLGLGVCPASSWLRRHVESWQVQFNHGCVFVCHSSSVGRMQAVCRQVHLSGLMVADSRPR